MHLPHNDPRISWHGHISLEQTDSHTRPWRIPYADRALYHPSLVQKAANPAGVRLAFHSTTRRLAGEILPAADNQSLDLFVDGQPFGTQDLAGAGSFAFADLPEGGKRIELWLPQAGDFALRRLEVDDGSQVSPDIDNRPRWITYGSSITQCKAAASPSQTWPALVARARGLNLLCLGFGGQCHLDVLIARTIRDLPADYLSICAGINIYGNGSLNARSFASSLIGCVQIIREKHPETPLALISPIFSRSRETAPNATGWTLQDYRDAVQETAALLREHGDRHIHYVSGLDLFDESVESLMPDGLHPGAEGYRQLGARFLERAAPVLFGP